MDNSTANLAVYSKKKVPFLFLIRILLLLVIASLASARAADLTWTTDGAGTWTNAAGGWTSSGGAVNWNNSNPDNATFGKGGTAGTISLGGPITAGGITFNAVGGTYLIQSGTLTLANNAVVAVNDDAATINSIIAGTNFSKSGTGTLTLGGANTFNGVFTINAGVVDISGAAQALGLGSVVVNSAEIAGGNSSAANIFNSVSSITLNSGTVRTRDSGNRTFGGSFVVTGTSTFITQKNNTSDNQVHTYGSLSIGTAQLNATSNAFTAGSAGTTFGAVTLTGNATFNPIPNVGTSTSEAINLGALNDNGVARTITKIGNGSLNLTANATSLVFGTQLNVTTGTVNSSAATALGSLAQVDVSSGATFTINTSAQTIAALTGTGSVTLNAYLTIGGANNLSSTFAGVIGGASGLTKIGTGTLSLTGANTFSGTLSIAAGNLNIATINNASTNGVLGNSGIAVVLSSTNGTVGTLQYTGSTASSTKTFNMGSGGSVATSGTGVFQIDNAAATLTLSGAIGGNGTMVKSGSGTVLINNTGNSMQAGIIVNSGKLQVSGAGGSSDPVSGVLGSYKNGAGARTITINNAGTMEFLTGNIFGPDGSNNYVSFVINGGGALTSTGTAAGSNFFQNLLTINGGGVLTTGTGVSVGSQSYRLNNNVAVGVGSGTAAYINAGGGGVFDGINLRNTTATTFTVADATSSSAADLIVSANLINSTASALTKDGAGTMLVSGSNTYTAATTVSAGVLQLGSVNALGTTAGNTVVTSGSATLDLNGQAIGAEAVTISGTGVGGSGVLVNTNTGTAASLAGNLTLTGSSSVGGAGNLTLSGTLIGAAATNNLVKVGAGTVTMSGSAGTNRSTVSATTQIDGGVLRVTGSNALATGTTAVSTINDTGVLELSGGITLDQPITFNNGATLRSSGTNTNNGKITVANSGTGTISTVGSGDIFTVGNGTDISGGNSSSLIKIGGPGTVLLSQVSDYVGNWSLDNGTTLLTTVTAGTQFGATNTASLTLNGGGIRIAYITPAATSFTSGAGNNVFVTANSIITSDRNAVGAGFVQTFGNLSIGSNQLSVAAGTNITSGTAGITFGNTTLTGNATFNVTNSTSGLGLLTLGSLTDSGTARTVTKSGNGTMTLGTAATSLVNGTQINVTGGVLNSNNATALGALAAVNVSSGATFATGNSQTIGALSGTGTVNIAGTTLTVGSSNNLSSVFAGAIAGSGGDLIKAGSGTFTLSGSNSYTGATTISVGTLVVGAGASIANGAVNVNAGTFVVHGAVGTGGVTVASGAILSGSGVIGGLTTILANATHSPGNSPGLQTFAAGLTYNTTSTFQWELAADTTSGRGTVGGYDGVDVAGGTLTIQTGVAANLVFNGIGSAVDFTTAFWDSNQSWLMFDNASLPTLASGAIFDSFGASNDSYGNTFASTGGALSFSQIGSDIYLDYTAVPEPSMVCLLGLGLGLMLHRFRRRSSR